MLRKGRRLLLAPAGSCRGAAGPSRRARDGAARSRPVPTAARRGEPGQGAAGAAVRSPRSRCSYLSLPESALAGQAPFALPPALPQPRLCPSPGSLPALPQPRSPLPPSRPLSAAEDASGELGDAVSTISSSMNPLQPPDASSEEPFTTYFDSKIPIPDDETVRAAGPLRSLRQLNPIGMSERSGATRVVPQAPVLLCAQTGEGAASSPDWGGWWSCWVGIWRRRVFSGVNDSWSRICGWKSREWACLWPQGRGPWSFVPLSRTGSRNDSPVPLQGGGCPLCF